MLITLETNTFPENSLQSSGSLPRMPPRRCVPVTFAGSSRRGNVSLHVRRPESGDQEVIRLAVYEKLALVVFLANTLRFTPVS